MSAGGGEGEAARAHAAMALLLALACGAALWLGGAGRAVAHSVGPAAGAAALATRLDVNAASAGELRTLPRIGPVLAQRIVEHRAAHGRFGALDDLQAVRGIGPRTVAGLRPHAEAR